VLALYEPGKRVPLYLWCQRAKVFPIFLAEMQSHGTLNDGMRICFGFPVIVIVVILIRLYEDTTICLDIVAFGSFEGEYLAHQL